MRQYFHLKETKNCRENFRIKLNKEILESLMRQNYHLKEKGKFCRENFLCD